MNDFVIVLTITWAVFILCVFIGFMETLSLIREIWQEVESRPHLLYPSIPSDEELTYIIKKDKVHYRL